MVEFLLVHPERRLVGVRGDKLEDEIDDPVRFTSIRGSDRRLQPRKDHRIQEEQIDEQRNIKRGENDARDT